MPSRSVYGVQAAFLLLIILLGILPSDIGRNHQIEKAVTRRTAELAEAESRFRQLAENINEGFWIVNADGRTIDYLSVGFEKIWQCRADAMLANRKIGTRVWCPTIRPHFVPDSEETESRSL